jgi:hypothetical protein
MTSRSTRFGLALTERAYGGGAVSDVGHLEPLVAQHDAEHLGKREVVIDDQNAALHQVSPLPALSWCSARIIT